MPFLRQTFQEKFDIVGIGRQTPALAYPYARDTDSAFTTCLHVNRKGLLVELKQTDKLYNTLYGRRMDFALK